MSIKTNLIIDGNYLMSKDVFILKKTRTIGQDLPVLMRRDFEKITKSYSFDNIFFVSDLGASWRKKEYSEYKGNRVKDNSIDWNQVYADYEEFKQEIALDNKVKMIQYNSLEGDDIIGYITTESNKKGFSNIIISSDSDLKQLLKFNTEKNYINLMWNYKYNDERIYLPRSYKMFIKHLNNSISEASIFDMNYDSEFLSFVEKLIDRCKVTESYHEEELFKKILQGDKKDNILSVIKLKDKEINDTGIGIGKAGAEKCYELYKDTYNDDKIDFKSEEFVNQAADIAAFYKKVSKREDIKEVIKENIKQNYKLLELDSSQLSIDLKKYLQKSISF